MTLSPIRLPRWRVLSPRDGVELPGWGSALPEPTAESIEAAAHLGMTRRWLRQLPGDWFAHLRHALAHVWCGHREEESVLELRLSVPGEEERVARTSDPLVRIGSAAGCHVALPGAVPAEHCELRGEGDEWVVVDLGSESRARVGEREIAAHERQPLEVGDVLEIDDARIELLYAGVRAVPPRVAVLTREVLATSEIERLFGPHPSEWVDLRVSGQDCFIRVDTSWTRFAYRALGYPLPEDSVDFDNEVDRGVTLFVLEKIVDELRRHGDLDVECRGYAPSSYVRRDARGEARRWVAGVFDLRLEDEALQVQVLWPWHTLAENPLPLRWVRGLEFPVSVLGGTTRLDPADLASLEVGDVVLPDRWTLQRGPDGIAVGGPVLLRIQNWNREADLRVTRNGQAVVVRTPSWNRSPEGALMPSDQVEPLEQESEEAGPRAIEDEIELTLAFELDRIAVPMRELADWQEGSTVVLKRSPEDRVRVLLQHGGGSKVVGSGRVVQVEGQLGVRLEEWWPQHEETDAE